MLQARAATFYRNKRYFITALILNAPSTFGSMSHRQNAVATTFQILPNEMDTCAFNGQQLDSK